MPLVFKKLLIKGTMIQLRPIGLSDAQVAFKLVVNNDEILKWLLWDGPRDENELASTYKRWHDGLGKTNNVYLAIEQIKTPGLIGCISLDCKDNFEQADMGYWLSVANWYKGYMTEAVRLVCYLGFKYLNLEKIYSPVFVGNMRSKHVLEKNGFSLEGVLRSHFKKHGVWRDVWYMALLRYEWKHNEHKYLPSYEDISMVELDHNKK
jgi:ribosomal-protein-alanine N-acetyltransferase